ncbi:hypothetical protein NH287_06810 [Microbacterium sp. CnD16-F]|uniref:hypothetical protein n=1 Tax=unclassified Microbacterium TaxID=2609290 RepID=UPI002096DF84|nr:hypothetical protein [Microbacterium sp. CnD16-F]MCO7203208.1 hypothetical protein [Microbacterium sp. CnD16-F]
MVVGIVEVDDVDPVRAQTGQAHVESSIDRRTTDIPDELWVELDAEGLAPDLTKGN